MNYVNMETNTVVLGYGCVAILPLMNHIQFSEIRPPSECGSTLITREGVKKGDWEYTGNRIVLRFDSYKEAKSFCEYLDLIEDSHGGSFEFKNITFDFNEYNQESIEVMKTQMKYVKNSLLMAIAC